MTEREPEHEYVDLMLDIKDGQIVGCEFHGEGRQAEPLTEPTLFRPLGADIFPRGLGRIERRIKRALREQALADGEDVRDKEGGK